MANLQSYVYRVTLPDNVPLHSVKHPIHCNHGFDHLDDGLKPSSVKEIVQDLWPQAETDELSLIIVLHLQAIP